MPAPLNTCLDRCNILDISSSFFFLTALLPFIPFLPSWSPVQSGAPCRYLLSTSWIQSSRGAELLLWSVRVNMSMCAKYTKKNVCPCRFHSFLSFPVNLPPSKNIPHPSFHNNPWYRFITREWKTFEQLHSTTSHGDLRLAVMLLPIWVRLPAASCDTCFHNLTRTLSHSSTVYLSISPFYYLMQPDLPSYSSEGTLYWTAAECREFLQRFHWLRAKVVPVCWLALRHALTMLLAWLGLLISPNWLMSFDFQGTKPLGD